MAQTLVLKISHGLAAALAVSCAIAFSGCGATSSSVGSLAQTGAIGYSASNMVVPNGYSEVSIGPDQYRIRATGFVENSRPELEKLATVRAADLAKSQNLKYFRIAGISENIVCGTKTTIGGKESREVVIKARRTVDLDVTFAKVAADATWQDSHQVFDTVRPELDAQSPLPASPEAAREEVRQKCGA